ncbi:hypothetical protein M427DRAFT_437305 [Gonapodya prolifera JEL478]|uniref:Uncharacterized protein n=1 Tax=Gonapodya prolifera (strain JEL478) TaxID=1344416 RepID=A0A139A449_GONPJ|nr:hypothetical protein M427DRAFT_437305 [Gonapodya prolifera JEL478]|eukprot:KXS11449.1 hypothetical protein M427DRAFT_437305 [Gonapodya prolifera JEL478]
MMDRRGKPPPLPPLKNGISLCILTGVARCSPGASTVPFNGANVCLRRVSLSFWASVLCILRTRSPSNASTVSVQNPPSAATPTFLADMDVVEEVSVAGAVVAPEHKVLLIVTDFPYGMPLAQLYNPGLLMAQYAVTEGGRIPSTFACDIVVLEIHAGQLRERR